MIIYALLCETSLTCSLHVGNFLRRIDRKDDAVIRLYEYAILPAHKHIWIVKVLKALTSIRMPMLWKCFGKLLAGGTYTPGSTTLAKDDANETGENTYS